MRIVNYSLTPALSLMGEGAERQALPHFLSKYR
jgi:hypothetical protein